MSKPEIMATKGDINSAKVMVNDVVDRIIFLVKYGGITSQQGYKLLGSLSSKVDKELNRGYKAMNKFKRIY